MVSSSYITNIQYYILVEEFDFPDTSTVLPARATMLNESDSNNNDDNEDDEDAHNFV